jgi:hypothetical protein
LTLPHVRAPLEAVDDQFMCGGVRRRRITASVQKAFVLNAPLYFRIAHAHAHESGWMARERGCLALVGVEALLSYRVSARWQGRAKDQRNG